MGISTFPALIRKTKPNTPYTGLHEDFSAFLARFDLTQHVMAYQGGRHPWPNHGKHPWVRHMVEYYPRNNHSWHLLRRDFTQSEQEVPSPPYVVALQTNKLGQPYIKSKLKNLDTTLSVKELWTSLKSILLEGAGFIPTKKTRSRQSKPWISAVLRGK